MSDFYLTLPSNSSMSVYPYNTMANFKTKLPNRIELDGRWEVGLVEMQYPHTWYNLREGEGEMTIVDSSEDGPISEVRAPIHISQGYYHTIDDLLRRIETDIARTLNLTKERPLRFHYDEIRRKVVAKVQPIFDSSDYTVVLGSSLQRILGFESHILSAGTTEAEFPVDMDPLHSIYVYCDLIEPRVVGDKMAQLLRVVPVEGRSGEMVTRIYENVHYTALQRKSFESVEIDIRDSLGEKVPFERGTLNVTLHFRRRRHLL